MKRELTVIGYGVILKYRISRARIVDFVRIVFQTINLVVSSIFRCRLNNQNKIFRDAEILLLSWLWLDKILV